MLLGSPRKNLEPYDKPFWNIFENRPFSGQNRVNWRVWGSPKFVFHLNPPIFVTWEPRQNFITLAAFFLVEKQGTQKKERRKRK